MSVFRPAALALALATALSAGAYAPAAQAANAPAVDIGYDSFTLPTGLRIANLEYPIHAAKVGGLPYRLVMTVSGLALALLGSLAVYTFWANPKFQKRKRPSTPHARA